MFLNLKRPWEVLEAIENGTHRAVVIPAGCYAIERIPAPGGGSVKWLVLRGTKIGAAEGYWRDWSNESGTDWGDFEVTITDTLPPKTIPGDVAHVRLPDSQLTEDERRAVHLEERRRRFPYALSPDIQIVEFFWAKDKGHASSVSISKEIWLNSNGKGDGLGDGSRYPIFNVYDHLDPSNTIPDAGCRVNQEPFLKYEDALAVAQARAKAALESGKWFRLEDLK